MTKTEQFLNELTELSLKYGFTVMGEPVLFVMEGEEGNFQYQIDADSNLLLALPRGIRDTTEPDISDRFTARVKLRRGKGWDVKEAGELIDGNTYTFVARWVFEEEHMCAGEWAMCPVDFENWPRGAPGWVATGDLENVNLVFISPFRRIKTHNAIIAKTNEP